MKVYLYQKETGMYLGEDYFDTSQIAGICEMPENATTIKPPYAGPSQVAAFKLSINSWEIRPLIADEQKGGE